MKFITQFSVVVISGLVFSCTAHKILLNDFIFDQQSLPQNCQIIKPTENESLPFNIPDNPYISSDTSFTNLASFLLKTDELNASIESALFSVYRCKNEIGINGIEFKTNKAAEKCEEILKTAIDDTARFNVFRNKNIVIQLWRDDVTDSCYTDLKEMIQDRLY